MYYKNRRIKQRRTSYEYTEDDEAGAGYAAEARHDAGEGSSGGGMVVVRLNGKGIMKKITLDAKLMDPSDKEMLEDLIVAAHNDAKTKVEANVNDQMGKITGGLNLPPGMK